MLKIKLSRLGKKKQPCYRILVAEAKSKRDGKYVELLGTYNPLAKADQISLDIVKFKEWLAKGAQPTDTVASLYKKFSLSSK